VYTASKDLWLTAKKMNPPWPNKAFNLRHPVRQVTFSPSGSQLSFCIDNSRTTQHVVEVWDRWGNETVLGGYTGKTHCLKYSLDGEHLASGSEYGSIRIWYTESFHTTASRPHIERPTQTPKQADAILVGARGPSTALSFSRTDSNLLASGGANGEIKVWNVKERACIHSFDSVGGSIRSLFFAGGAGIACIAVRHTMSIIRLWRAEGSSDFASETIGEADPGGLSLADAAFSPSGSFLAIAVGSRTGNESTLALYELETMTKTQSVVMPNFTAIRAAVSPDSKQLVVGDYTGRIRLLQADDFSIQRDLDTRGEGADMPAWSVAIDPTCRVLAVGYRDGRLELRTL
jgi:WD40 repeat protein